MKLFGFLLLLSFPISVYSQGYTIRFKLKDFKGKEIYLGFNYGDKKYLKDTAQVDKNGEYVFKGDKPLDKGIYLMVLPSKRYFEFIVDEQNFSIETDTADFVKTAKVKGSENNTEFFKFVNFATPRQAKIMQYASRLDTIPDNSDSVKIYRKWITEQEKEINDYRTDIINRFPSSFIGKLFAAMKEPVVPEAPLLPNGKKDSTFNFRYFKAHYFDGFDWSDGGLSKTPILHNKIKYFLDRLTVQIPDSVIAEADFLINKASANKENYKYVVHYITSTYERSNVMGMENVFVHVAKKYYTKQKAFWADSTTISKIQERASALEPIIIGKIAPNITLPDTSFNVWYSLNKIKSPYTVLYFWDPDCGHCQKVTPKLGDIARRFNDKGVTVFAVCTQREIDKWKKFIIEKKLDFINVAIYPDMVEHPEKYVLEKNLTDIGSLNFHRTYDIYSTPQVYLLDENKKIIGRRLGVEDLEGYLNSVLERDKRKK